MSREAKEQIIAQLSGKLRQASFAVLTNYRGLNVEKITQLRRDLRKVSSDYHVAKNTFLKKASQGTEFEQLEPFLVGPTAILLSYDDPVAPSKVLMKFLGAFSELSIKAGILQGRVLSAEEVKALSTLPSKRELLGRVVSVCAQPQLWLLHLLRTFPLKLLQVLHAIKQGKAGK